MWLKKFDNNVILIVCQQQQQQFKTIKWKISHDTQYVIQICYICLHLWYKQNKTDHSMFMFSWMNNIQRLFQKSIKVIERKKIDIVYLKFESKLKMNLIENEFFF